MASSAYSPGSVQYLHDTHRVMGRKQANGEAIGRSTSTEAAGRPIASDSAVTGNGSKRSAIQSRMMCSVRSSGAVRTAIFNTRRGRRTGDELYDGFVRTFLKNIVERSINDLEHQGFSRRRVKRRLHLALIPPLPGSDEPKACDALEASPCITPSLTEDSEGDVPKPRSTHLPKFVTSCAAQPKYQGCDHDTKPIKRGSNSRCVARSPF